MAEFISLWDYLPLEIQDTIIHIRDENAATLIQNIYRKNRTWFFKRLNLIKKRVPEYTGKQLRCSDRVLVFRKDRKRLIGTISSISYCCEYYCCITLLNNKKVYYYKKDKYIQPDEIVYIKVLNSWNHCICNKYTDNTCDQCVFQK